MSPGGFAQRRAIFFSFDGGTGVGHLSRLARIAKRLQGRFACLLVTGHRPAAEWLIPDECEYVHLPSWDSLLESKSRYWGRAPFLSVDDDDAVRLRKGIIGGVVEAFRPDAIFVDHLPLGAHEELADVVRAADGLKYLVSRGIQNETEDLPKLILGGAARESMESHYHRILVAADPRVFDFTRQYDLSPAISRKTVHTGYVVDEVPPEIIRTTRADRGLASGDRWVVASAGGGQRGEELIAGCVRLASHHRDVVFDIVQGPRSSLPWQRGSATTMPIGDNVRLHRETRQMPYLHASADVVISTAGYNSLLETLQGNAKILCFPFRKDERDEQHRHAARLREFVDLEVSSEVSDLPTLFEKAIRSPGPRDRRRDLDYGGAEFIERVVLDDLGRPGP